MYLMLTAFVASFLLTTVFAKDLLKHATVEFSPRNKLTASQQLIIHGLK